MSESIDVTVLIPVFNGEQTIGEVVSRTAAVLESEGLSFELVLVDDRSRDDSWRVIEALAAADPRIVPIRLMRNFGQHAALLAGIRLARGERIVTMDDDLQHPPEELPKLFEEMQRTGADVVYGTPDRMQQGLFRNLASWLIKLALGGGMRGDAARHVSALRLFRTCLRDAFARYNSPFVSIDVLLSWGAARSSWVRVRHLPRAAGASNYTFTALIGHALTMLTGFSTVPLRFASIVGFCFTLLGMIVLAYVLVIYLVHGRAVPGFAFLASIITIFGGTQLFALGIIGEYLARVHLRLMGKPPYVVESRPMHGPGRVIPSDDSRPLRD
ncbi:MAG: glycosyltransferase family 2 protein [Thermoanaerobaculia bacterium]